MAKRVSKKRESVSVRLDDDVREALDRYAAEDRRSLSWMINEACRGYMERREGKSGRRDRG
jgi:predicted transcriptional regulator